MMFSMEAKQSVLQYLLKDSGIECASKQKVKNLSVTAWLKAASQEDNRFENIKTFIARRVQTNKATSRLSYKKH